MHSSDINTSETSNPDLNLTVHNITTATRFLINAISLILVSLTSLAMSKSRYQVFSWRVFSRNTFFNCYRRRHVHYCIWNCLLPMHFTYPCRKNVANTVLQCFPWLLNIFIHILMAISCINCSLFSLNTSACDETCGKVNKSAQWKTNCLLHQVITDGRTDKDQQVDGQVTEKWSTFLRWRPQKQMVK